LKRLVSIFAVIFLSIPAFGVAAFDMHQYARLTYDYEVAAYCGLLTSAIESAYRRARGVMESKATESAEMLKKSRIKALAAAAREYKNRSLGGHRA